MEQCGLLTDRQSQGKVVIVDDQYYNQQIMKRHFSDIGLGEHLRTFNDGQSAIQYIEMVLDGLQDPNIVHEQPITLLLLDVQMPLMNGFETLKFVKEAYKKHNA